MSKQKEVPSQPPQLTPEQQNQRIFSRLSAQFKTPIRTILSETEEMIQNTISTIIQEMIQINNALKTSNQEITRLQKLCTDNNIQFGSHPANRAERRAKDRKRGKEVKDQSKINK